MEEAARVLTNNLAHNTDGAKIGKRLRDIMLKMYP